MGSLKFLVHQVARFIISSSPIIIHVYNLKGSMCLYSLPIGCVYPHRLECGFTQDGLSRTFPRGRVANQHKFVELPLTLRGHSLGQSKEQVESISLIIST